MSLIRNRVKEIKAKGFNLATVSEDDIPLQPNGLLDFSKIKVGAKTLNDAIFKLGDLKNINPQFSNKEFVLKAINDYDIKTMREISHFFFRISGIYSRVLLYMSGIYKYDWFLTPHSLESTMIKNQKLIEGFKKGLNILDKFHAKKTFNDIALTVLKDGVFYGYKIVQGESVTFQQLHCNYCRTRWFKGDKPVVEFNMKYFDDFFKDTEQRNTILKVFPAEFTEGYKLFKAGKLPPQFQGDSQGWFMLNPDMTVRFTLNGEEYPFFISTIPLILDLDEAQALDRKKSLQRLLKIVIQKMPLDKNGDLIFDIDEASQLHNNAVQMLSRAIGVDVLTTFADVSVEEVSDSKSATSQTDDLERVERQLFNEMGISQLLFNTDGNIAMDKSLIKDSSTMYNLISQFEVFLNDIISGLNNKKIEYRVQILPTTIFNYQELAKAYKDQMQSGFSKMLPQIAMGQSQSAILDAAYFENDILNLVEVFIPPLSSATTSGKTLLGKDGGGEPGRPEKPDSEKSTKTLQNIESQS